MDPTPTAAAGAPPQQTQRKQLSQNFWALVWRRFKKNRPALAATGVLVFLFAVALLHPMIVGTRPIACEYKGQIYFPVVWYYVGWENPVFGVSGDKFRGTFPANLQNKDPESWAIWPLVYQDPYRKVRDREWEGLSGPPWEGRPGSENNSAPHRYNFFGTDAFGRDVFARLVHGTPIALLVGFVSMGIATLIGLIVGSAAGYYGDERLRLTPPTLVAILAAAMFLAVRWSSGAAQPAAPPSSGQQAVELAAESPAEPDGSAAPADQAAAEAAPAAPERSLIERFTATFLKRTKQLWKELLVLLLTILAVAAVQSVSRSFEGSPWLSAEVLRIPADLVLSRFMEVVQSIPTLILILALIAIIPKPTIWDTMTIIGATSWVGIARLVRGEFLKLRGMEFAVAADALGASDGRIMFRHLLPNALAPVLVSISFGIATAILIESGLSFLGFGVQPPTPSWGSVLRDGFQDLSQWWLVLFPGAAIFVAVFTYNLVGDGLQEAMDPRLKR
jgi:peptide/nickel transport system permease protein